MTLIQQSHEKLVEELAKTKEELQKMIRLNAELQDELNKHRKAVREARQALGRI